MEEYYGVDEYHVVADPNNEYIDHIDCWAKFLSPTKMLIRSVPTSHSQYDEIEEIVNYFENNTTFNIFRVYTLLMLFLESFIHFLLVTFIV